MNTNKTEGMEADPVGAVERKLFESWAIGNYFDVAKDAYGNYCSADLQRYWNGWRARAALAERGTVGEPVTEDFHISVAVEPNGTYVQVFDGEKRLYEQFHEMPSPVPVGDGGLPVQASFEDWCATKGLTPERCDETNFWIRQAYEDAQRSHAAPQVAQVVAGGLTDAERVNWIEARIKDSAAVWFTPCGPDLRSVQVRHMGDCYNYPTVEGLRQAIDAAILAAKETTS